MDRTALRTLGQLLTTRDVAAITQGVELAVSLGDGEVVDALLDGVRFDRKRQVPLPGAHRWWWGPSPVDLPGGVVANQRFTGNSRSQEWLELALLTLIARGPGESAAALRRAITGLTWVVSDADHAPVVDLSVLRGLLALRSVRVSAPRGVVGADVLGDLPALEEVDLRTSSRHSVDTWAGLGRARALQRLVFFGAAVDVSALAACGATTVYLQTSLPLPLPPLAALPRLTVAKWSADGFVGTLSGSPVQDLHLLGDADLGDLPALRRLVIRGSLAGLRSAPALTHVECASLTGAPPLPALQEVSLDELGDADVPPAGALPALRVLKTRQLALSRWASLAAFPLVDVLDFGWVGDTVATDGLPSLSWATDDGVLSLHRAQATLRSIGDLGRLPGLRQLVLRDCRELRTLEGLQGATDLRTLDLRGCVGLVDLGALAGLDLRAIAVAGCPRALEGGLPDDVAWAAVRAKDADLAALADRPRPTAPPKRPPKPLAAPVALDEVAWASIAVDLASRDDGVADAALDRVRALGRPAYQRLLDRGSYVEKDGALRAPGVPLRGTTALKQHLVRRLFAEAPADLAVVAKVRAQVTSLRVSGPAHGDPGRVYGRRHHLELRPLAVFPNLRSVSFTFAATAGPWEVLAHTPLQHVQAGALDTLPDATPFARPGLLTLNLRARTLDGLGAAVDLRELTALEHPELAPAYGLVHLEVVRGVTVADPARLGELPALRVLAARGPSGFDGARSASLQVLSLPGPVVGELRGLSALRELVVHEGREPLRAVGKLPPSLAALSLPRLTPALSLDLPHLSSLELVAFDDAAAAALAGLPGVTTLKLGWEPTRLAALLQAPIQELWLQLASSVDDLAGLVRHPTLQRVVVRRDDRARHLVPRSLRVDWPA
jgi:hypothetical protein